MLFVSHHRLTADSRVTLTTAGSFILAFTVRSGVNVVLLLFKALGKRKKLNVASLRTAIIGEDSWRFGAMIGESR